jgi:hypothetical protein
MKHRLVTVGLLTAAALAAATGSAFADDCANVSRAAPACDMSCTAPVVEGNWVWLPSIGEPIAAWGFAPPGGPDSVGVGLPGANGNYTNAQADDLLGVAAQHSAGVCTTPNRTTDPANANGVISGACATG